MKRKNTGLLLVVFLMFLFTGCNLTGFDSTEESIQNPVEPAKPVGPTEPELSLPVIGYLFDINFELASGYFTESLSGDGWNTYLSNQAFSSTGSLGYAQSETEKDHIEIYFSLPADFTIGRYSITSILDSNISDESVYVTAMNKTRDSGIFFDIGYLEILELNAERTELTGRIVTRCDNSGYWLEGKFTVNIAN